MTPYHGQLQIYTGRAEKAHAQYHYVGQGQTPANIESATGINVLPVINGTGGRASDILAAEALKNFYIAANISRRACQAMFRKCPTNNWWADDESSSEAGGAFKTKQISDIQYHF